MKEVDQEFWDIADEFIKLANTKAKNISRSKVSVAFLYAVTRYNSFISISQDENPEDNKEEALKYFLKQYKLMFLDNYEDQQENKK